MKEAKAVTIQIVDHRLTFNWIKKLLAIAVWIALPVSIGIYFDSSAMQWFGFLATIVMMLVYAHRRDRETTFHSIRSARAYLDTISTEPRDVN